MLILFGTTIFVGASLLFLVQPMFARMALPLLGGAPAVWNTAMVFYQAVLLAGYAYAHVTMRWLGPRRQAGLHLVILLVPLAVLPIAVPAGWIPPGDDESHPLAPRAPRGRGRAALLRGLGDQPGAPGLVRGDGPPGRAGTRTSSTPRATSAACWRSSRIRCSSSASSDLGAQSRLWAWGYGILVAAGSSPARSRSGGRGAAHRGDERGGGAPTAALAEGAPAEADRAITPRGARAGSSWPPSRPA